MEKNDNSKRNEVGNALHAFADKAAQFLAATVKKIQKMDRRMLIMIAAAVLLVIVIFALIIGGINSKKKNNDDIPTPEPSTVEDEDNIEDVYTPQDDVPVSSGAAKYTVQTNSVPSLNLRSRPSTGSEILTSIPKGTVVDVYYIYEFNGEKWGVVSYDGEIGFSSMDYLVKK